MNEKSDFLSTCLFFSLYCRPMPTGMPNAFEKDDLKWDKK